MGTVTIEELYETLGKERDKNAELSEVKDATTQAYYLGMATAYDTVRGWVFAMIGEEEEL